MEIGMEIKNKKKFIYKSFMEIKLRGKYENFILRFEVRPVFMKLSQRPQIGWKNQS